MWRFPTRGDPQQGPANWMSGFLPAVYQGTSLSADKPIRHLARPREIAPGDDQAALDFLRLLNDEHLQRHPGDTDLARGSPRTSWPRGCSSALRKLATCRARARRPACYMVSTIPTRSSPASAATACWRAGCWNGACGSSPLQRGLRDGRGGTQLGWSQTDQVGLRPARTDPRQAGRRVAHRPQSAGIAR